MALEPRTFSAEEEPSEELQDMTRRFWVSCAFTLPLLLIAMGEMAGFAPLREWSFRSRNWVELALATPVVLWGGWPFFVRGWKSIVTLRLNMFTLIAMGTGAAYLYSVVATLAPGIFPAAFRGPNGEVAVYFEAAAVITTLVLLGQVLELRARRRTSNAIRAMLGLSPKTARRIAANGEEADVPLERGGAWRSAARAAGRAGAGGRRDFAGRQRGGRIDDHGRAAAGGEARGRLGHRRHAERLGQLYHARRARGHGDAAGANREDGRRSAAQPRADPAAGRYGGRLFRSRGVIGRRGDADCRGRFWDRNLGWLMRW